MQMFDRRRRTLQAHRGRIAAGVVAVAVVVPLWLFFGPAQLGGSSTYSITEGTSMQPLLEKNDLALVRPQSSYKVGQIVLYQSSTLHRPVLHRIVVIQNGHYFFKGDSNNFVDPGYATKSELTGKLWFHVQAVGGILGWIGSPWHASVLAALTAAFLLLGGTAVERRRTRRRGPLTTASAPHEHQPRYLEPVTQARLTTIGVLAIVGVVLAGVGLAAPLNRTVAVQGAYRDTGVFSYIAHATKRTPSYPTGTAVTGQPILVSLFNSAIARFNYRFVSPLSHHVHGTIEFQALLLSQSSGWQNLYTVKAKMPFTGDTAETSGALKLRSLYTLLNEISSASGTPGAEYSIDLQPVVHVVGTVAGKPITSTFSPVLPVAVTPSVVRLDVPPAVTPPGATYTQQTAAAALGAVLRPFQAGSIPRVARNHIAIARYRVPVLDVRLIALIALGLAGLLAILHGHLSRRDSRRPIEERIAAHFGLLVAPVDALELPADTTPTIVHDFTGLATLARYLERPILRETDATGTTYAVDDETRTYQYRTSVMKPALVASAPAPAAPSHGQELRTGRWALGGVAVALVIAITLVASFTATTTVPASRAGVSKPASAMSQITPVGCSSLALQNIVRGSGNFTNNASHMLILGTSSANTITDNGTYNCIVAGGGKDVVYGDRTDVCIIGPGSGTSYYSCTKRTG